MTAEPARSREEGADALTKHDLPDHDLDPAEQDERATEAFEQMCRLGLAPFGML